MTMTCEVTRLTKVVQRATCTTRTTQVTQRDIIHLNPCRFSSEVHDDTLGLVYYNHRHYNPMKGRWFARDPLGEVEANIIGFIRNNPLNDNDAFGLSCCGETIYDAKTYCCVNDKDLIKKAKTCIAKIYLGHFGGRSVDETAKEQTFVTSAYITCFAKKMNEQAFSAWENEQEYGNPRQKPWTDYGRNWPLLQEDVYRIVQSYLKAQKGTR